MKARAQSPVFKPAIIRTKSESPFSTLPDFFATAYVAATVLLLTFAGLFGVAPILLLYAIWFRYIKYKGQNTLRITKDIVPPILLVSLCVFSTVWSDYRSVTAKASLEFVSMVAVTIIVARIVSIEALLKGFVIGLFIAVMVPFKSGSYSIEGVFGSKNVVGSLSEMGLYFSLILVFTQKNRLKNLFFFGIPIILFCAGLYFGKSGTSVASLLGAGLISFLAYFLGRVPLRMRMGLLMAGLFAGCLLVIAGFYLGAQKAGLNALGKDATLTGRTVLWSEGIRFGLQSPLTGCGYFAFWVPGRPLAEKLWFDFYIFDRTGFHFHNLIVNTFVELGLGGVLIVIYIYMTSIMASFRFLVRKGANLESVFYVGISIMFLMRAMAEVDTTGPFGMGPLLLFSVVPRIAEKLKVSPDQVAPKKPKLGLPSRGATQFSPGISR